MGLEFGNARNEIAAKGAIKAHTRGIGMPLT